jgi:hypothetical protein
VCRDKRQLVHAYSVKPDPWNLDVNDHGRIPAGILAQHEAANGK